MGSPETFLPVITILAIYDIALIVSILWKLRMLSGRLTRQRMAGRILSDNWNSTHSED